MNEPAGQSPAASEVASPDETLGRDVPDAQKQAEPEQAEPQQANQNPAAPPLAKPRVGVPVWRVGKPDAVLAAAVGPAREAVATIAKEAHIGAHLGVRSEGVRVATHLFEAKLPGYVGWQWFAVLTRVSRAKDITVNEVGLLPSEDSVLAPAWVPWAERVRPEDAAAQAAADLEAAGDTESAGETGVGGDPETGGDALDEDIAGPATHSAGED